ncbi:MAG: HAD family phosphatase [Candidatus Absconditicoccaceae bacterium]
MQTHIVFDLDGTIADTQKIHQQIESDFLKSRGCIMIPEIIGVKYAGRSPQERISELLSSENIDFKKRDIDNFVDNKDNIVIDLLQKGEIQLMPYAVEILQYLNNKNYKIGLSSGACREFINQFIKYFNLENIIIASTSANEVEKKKPNPDVFLSSFNQIEKIHGKPEMKYVVGDGRSDIEGGYRSGSKTVRLNYLKKTKLNDIYCNFEITSLKYLKDIL